MSKGSEAVKRWRQNTKARMIESLGGKCCICGYNTCDDALECHHLDPTEKEFTFSDIRGNIKGWETLVRELRKCVLLCSNCHKEVHSSRSSTEVPNDAPRFNEAFADYKVLQRKELMDTCPICEGEKPKHQKTCSYSCAARLSGKTDWSKIDVIALVEECGSFEEAGRRLGLSGAAVGRRFKKVNSLVL